MQLYNTLTRNVDTVEPLNPPTVTVYTCGPTVYDYLHIGNWFTYIREDLLIRTLRSAGQQPNWVMNITDVGHLVSDADEGEDKLEKGARREGKTAWQVAEFYTDYFMQGMEKLNMLQPTHLTKATDHIAEQIELIQKLEAKGFTYVISDGVYYDTSKFSKYADFARLDLDEQQEGARVEVNREKRNPTDFALWKFSPQNHKRDMEWDSPWGMGFPGWHIECSAMAMKYLGETLDIHAGGIDHVPVHHTNEIAQSEAVTGKPFSRFWFHANHIMINGEKIAKSAGNGILLEDIEKAGFSIEAFRLLVLESHYRTQSHFSWDTLEAARNRLRGYCEMAALVWQPVNVGTHDPESFSRTIDEIKKYLQDDLNTPLALATLSSLSDSLKATLVNSSDVKVLREFLTTIDELLGTKLSTIADINDEQKELITKRQQVREAKDWAKSDELRDQLGKQGIGVRDTPSGPIWYRL
jgi:cysteinyl-tRNA synthetase